MDDYGALETLIAKVTPLLSLVLYIPSDDYDALECLVVKVIPLHTPSSHRSPINPPRYPNTP